MSKSWSSFENDRLIMESWRKHLAEEPEKVEELFGFGKSREDKWARIAQGDERPGDVPETPQECPPGCCPCPGEEGQQPEEEYPAADYTSLYKTLDDVNNQLGGTVDRNALNKELQQLFKDQNFIVKERKIKMEAQGEVAGGKLILGRQPNFNLEKYPTLARLSQAAAANPKLAKALQGAFTRAGFEGVASAQAAAPEETAPEEEIPDVTGELEPEEDPEEGDVEGEEDDVELEPDNIYVFKGKAGKGLQSQLSKVGVQGQDMSALLKGLRSDLSAAGFTVLEEAKREIIALTNTLAALEQMADPGQKEAAKKILALMLRANKVKLDPQSSRALTPVAPAEEPATPAQDPRTKAEKIKAGDSFQYTSGPGTKSVVQVVKEPTPETQGFAQVQKIDPETCQPQNKRKFATKPEKLTAPYDQCSTGQQGAGEQVSLEAQPGMVDSEKEDPLADYPLPEPVSETLQRWQKIAGIIKG